MEMDIMSWFIAMAILGCIIFFFFYNLYLPEWLIETNHYTLYSYFIILVVPVVIFILSSKAEILWFLPIIIGGILWSIIINAIYLISDVKPHQYQNITVVWDILTFEKEIYTAPEINGNIYKKRIYIYWKYNKWNMQYSEAIKMISDDVYDRVGFLTGSILERENKLMNYINNNTGSVDVSLRKDDVGELNMNIIDFKYLNE